MRRGTVALNTGSTRRSTGTCWWPAGSRARVVRMSRSWWSIEVLDGVFPATRWQDAHSAALIEAAIAHGAKDWNWQAHHWGVIFEVAFRDSDDWASFRQLPAVTAALDAVPDPINGLLIHQGRGGSSNSADPRRPRPRLGAGAAPVPQEPVP